MRKFSFAILALASAFFIPPKAALAGPATDALSACIADFTTGRDRKNLIRWMFSALSAHPEIKDITTVTSAMQEDLSRQSAKLLERLLVEDCNKQAREAMKVDGPKSVEAAFETLGKVAMLELMQDRNVAGNFEKLGTYVDNKRLGDALK